MADRSDIRRGRSSYASDRPSYAASGQDTDRYGDRLSYGEQVSPYSYEENRNMDRYGSDRSRRSKRGTENASPRRKANRSVRHSGNRAQESGSSRHSGRRVPESEVSRISDRRRGNSRSIDRKTPRTGQKRAAAGQTMAVRSSTAAVRSVYINPFQRLARFLKEDLYLNRDTFIVKDADYYDYNLLAVVILLTCFGLVMLYSTTAYEYGMSYFLKQTLISIAALVVALGISAVDYHVFSAFSMVIYVISTILLVATKFIGKTVNGATRWIGVGAVTFQPSELAKLAIILFLPSLIVSAGHEFRGWKRPFKIFLPGLLSAGCTYIFTDNLSTGLIIGGITVILIFMAHPETKPFLAMGAGGIVLIAGVLFYLINYAGSTGSFRIARIQTWLHPEQDANGKGYQITQALYAIGSGGFMGKGLGNSTQKLGSIPEAHNDMIFSIICEELGIFGAVMVIILFLFLLYRLFVIANNAPDLLGSLMVTGVFIHIALQVVLNIAVVTNTIPTTGITLPFVSYGGTSILFLMSEMGVVLSVSRQIRFKSK